MATRIALIHATPVAVEPVRRAFKEIWPEAQTCNLLEDSLSPDLAAAGRLNMDLSRRIRALALYEAEAGAEGILFTCSAFGSAIDAVAGELAIPVLKPNEAMFRQAIASGNRIAMIATFPPALAEMEAEFHEEVRRRGRSVELKAYLVPEAMAALRSGDDARHNELVAECAGEIRDCDTIMLAHFSTARALAVVGERTNVPVLTSPDSAVQLLKRSILEGRGEG